MTRTPVGSSSSRRESAGPRDTHFAECLLCRAVRAVILGMIAQAVTGEPIQQLITQPILRPLDLAHTSFPTAAAPRTCQCRVTPWRERMRSPPRVSSHRPNCRGPARPEP